MPINPISAINSTPQGSTPQSTLDMNTFLRLLTVQLSTQNPLEPMDDKDFFAQLAQLGQVQGMDQLKSSMAVQQASSLMDKTVTAVGTTDSGTAGIITGVVTKLNISNGQYYLQLKTADGGIAEVTMGNIQSVEDTPKK